MTPPEPGRLVAVAGWDAGEVRSGVAALTCVVDELPSWRARVEGIGRRLREGAWTGRAAGAASGSIDVLGVVAAAVGNGLAEALTACRRLPQDAGTAAGLARAALAAVDGDAARALERETLEHAARVTAALDAAGTTLSGLGVRDAFAPADFADLAGRVRPVPVPAPPPYGPREVAAWWTALPVLAREAFLQQRPAVAGALDGLPAAARDRANRLLLARAMRRPDPSPTARAVAAVLASHEAAGDSVQLHLFDEAGERVAVGLGDADAADALTVLVPGIATTPDDDLDAVTADVARAVGAAEAAGAGAVAGVAWLGYRPPRGSGILFRHRAAQAGPVLDAALDGISASRASGGGRAPRLTVLAHSYGTVVLDEAAEAPGRLAADAVVLLGSPGTDDFADAFEGAEVYEASSPADPVSWSGWFGASTWGPSYGAVDLPVAAGTGHSGYLDAGPTSTAVGEVVARTRGAAP